MLHFGIHSAGQGVIHLVHQLNIGLGRMVPIHWPWPKEEVRLLNIKLCPLCSAVCKFVLIYLLIYFDSSFSESQF